jgi:hypothetical protein
MGVGEAGWEEVIGEVFLKRREDDGRRVAVDGMSPAAGDKSDSNLASRGVRGGEDGADISVHDIMSPTLPSVLPSQPAFTDGTPFPLIPLHFPSATLATTTQSQLHAVAALGKITTPSEYATTSFTVSYISHPCVRQYSHLHLWLPAM